MQARHHHSPGKHPLCPQKSVTALFRGLFCNIKNGLVPTLVPCQVWGGQSPTSCSNMHITKACLAPCLQRAEPEAFSCFPKLPLQLSAALELRRRPSTQCRCDPSPGLWQPLTPVGAHQAPLKTSHPTHLFSLTLSSQDTGVLDFTVLLSPSIEDKHFSEISHGNIMKKVDFYDSDR